MFRSWKLGTAFGIGIFVHWSFLLLPLLVLWSNPETGLLAGLFVTAFIVAVFSCVVLHELGHALMARHFGIPTRDITLYPIGGVARLERMSERPWEEFWIAVAGPAVNVVIAAALIGVLVLMNLWAPIEGGLEQLPLGAFFLLQLLAINIVMIAFNMLPAFPMDGGRVLRALLSSGLGHPRATETAATVGVFFAGLIILTGFGLFQRTGFELLQGSPMMVFVGLFVLFAGQQELWMVRGRERIRDLQRRGLWPSWQVSPETLARQPSSVVVQSTAAPAAIVPDRSALPAVPNYTGFTWDAGRRAWIEWRDGQPVRICWVE